MEPTSASGARQGRRLLAAILAAVSIVAAVVTLVPAATSAADTTALAPRASASASSSPSATPTCFLRPADCSPPSPTPSCDPTSDPSACSTPTPIPSPSVQVVSPVPESPSSSPTIPSYLQGAEPTPSAKIGETVSSPVPLGGGFVDQLPTPSSAPAAPTGTLTPHQSALPLPFLAVGALLILGAIGSLIYAVAPRDKKYFVPQPTKPTSPVMFTPYGPDSQPTNILRPPGEDPRPRL